MSSFETRFERVELKYLIDEAFAARSALLEAQERAGSSAYCTLLAMRGVPVEQWPRK
jgi:hypothetical protein